MASTSDINRQKFIDTAKRMYGDSVKEVTRSQMMDVCKEGNLKWPAWLAFDPQAKTPDGKYILFPPSKPDPKYMSDDERLSVVPEADENIYELAQEKAKRDKEKTVKTKAVVEDIEDAEFSQAAYAALNHAPEIESMVPEKAIGYVPFGHYDDVSAIVKSGIFYPIYITGFSGNGKTMMVEQIHAELGRELIRVNITIETDEDDLLGGFRLVNGRTVWHDGPVVAAMERGATLLLDEVDLGSNKIMCLQPVLEGKHIYLKKTKRLVHPAPGFNIIATANTKGKGSEDGRFIGTNVQNEAFLDRFATTFEQEYPSAATEMKILVNTFAKHNMQESDFVEKLVKWAGSIRRSFENGSLSEIISTRRLVNICDAFAIFESRKKAIELCIARFDDEMKTSFWKFYAQIDDQVDNGNSTSNKVSSGFDPAIGNKIKSFS